MKPSRKFNFSSSTTPVTYTFKNDHTAPPPPQHKTTEIPITVVHLPTSQHSTAAATAAITIQSAYRSHIIRTLIFSHIDAASETALRDNASLRLPMNKVEMLLPTAIGDYTDFYSSMHHVKNCGAIIRGPENPIPANWFHMPIAYHGRASSIVISGTDIVRPLGQGYPTGNSPPYFGPSLELDFELEIVSFY